MRPISKERCLHLGAAAVIADSERYWHGAGCTSQGVRMRLLAS
jgi:hypothetical protein